MQIMNEPTVVRFLIDVLHGDSDCFECDAEQFAAACKVLLAEVQKGRTLNRLPSGFQCIVRQGKQDYAFSVWRQYTDPSGAAVGAALASSAEGAGDGVRQPAIADAAADDIKSIERYKILRQILPGLPVGLGEAFQGRVSCRGNHMQNRAQSALECFLCAAGR